MHGKGGNRTSSAGVNDERERELQGREADRPQKRREGGLMSTPRQWPSWEMRGGWGKVTMISRSIEISIVGGAEEMVRAYLSVVFFFFFLFFVIMRYLFLGTKSLMQR